MQLEPKFTRKVAFQQYQRLVRLGDEIDNKRMEQLGILHWFWEEPRRYQEIGFDSFKELFFQEEVQRALKLQGMSRGAQSKYYGLFKIDVLIPEADVLGDGRSKVAAALPELRPLADALLAAPPEMREEGKRELWREVDKYRAQPVREVEERIQAQRETPYHYTSENGKPAVGRVNGDGELTIILVQTDDCDPIAFATVVRRLTRRYSNLMIDDDGLWTYADSLSRPAARWAHNGLSPDDKQAVAEACRAEWRV